MKNNTIRLSGNSIYDGTRHLENRREIIENNRRRIEEIFRTANEAEVWAAEIIKDIEGNIIFKVEPKQFKVKLNEEYISGKYPNIDKKAILQDMSDGMEFYYNGERYLDVRYNITGYTDERSTHITPISMISVFSTEEECKSYYSTMKK